MKWLAIINPVSGGNNTHAQLPQILFELKRVMSVCVVTEYPGHARELAAASAEFDGIAVVGGDGTMFDVLRGMDVSRQHFAIIPAGTGNSFARDLRLTTIRDGIDALQYGHLVCVDLLRVTLTQQRGNVTSCLAGSTIGVGYPANTVNFGNQHSKRFGRFCYPVAATIETFFQQPVALRISRDGGVVEPKRLTGLLINNTRHAGNFQAFPHASFCDGQLDIMELQAGWLGQNLHNLSVLSQRYFYAPAALHRAETVGIALERPGVLMIDGELFFDVADVNVRIEPQALRCYRIV